MRIQLIASVYRDVDILPHFLKHYAACGVDRFLFLVHANPDPAFFNAFKKAACKYRVDVAGTIQTGPFDFRENLVELNRIRLDYILPDEYFVTCDLDEFIDPPNGESFQDLAKDCASKGYTKYAGRLVDRVTADGSLPAIKPDPPIEMQFPVGCDLTRVVLKGATSKVQFQLGKYAITVTNTFTGDGLLYPDRFNVNHYKWNANVVPRLKERVKEYEGRYPWYAESQRFINHWKKHGKIDLKNPDLRVWNGPTT